METNWQGTITIISENSVFKSKESIAEEGLSVLIEEKYPTSKKVLIDTGRRLKILQHNLGVHNLSLNNIDTFVLTHGHAGHIGALSDCLKFVHKPVYVFGNGIEYPKFKKSADGKLNPVNLEFDIQKLQSVASSVIQTNQPYYITNHIVTSGFIPIKYLEALGNRENDKHWIKKNNLFLLDEFEEEISVFIKSPIGIIVITACAHRGINNIVHQAIQQWPSDPIYLIIGGFHTQQRPETLMFLSEKLLEQKVNYVAPGHCTGFYGKCHLYKVFNTHFLPLSTGVKFDFRNTKMEFFEK